MVWLSYESFSIFNVSLPKTGHLQLNSCEFKTPRSHRVIIIRSTTNYCLYIDKQ